MVTEAIRPGYKRTEVGVIPEDWDVEEFGKHLEIISGVGFKKSEYTNQGVKLLRIDNVSYGQITWESVAHLPNHYLQKYPKLKLQAGDILLALNRPITNDKLKIAIIQERDAPCILYQRVGKITPKTKSDDKKYVFYILNKFIKKFVEETSVGSDQPFISIVKLRNYRIPFPKQSEEQQAISQSLSDTDAFIESLNKLIAKKKNIKKGAMQELLTGKRRLPRFEMNSTYKRTDVGVIPEDWALISFRDTFHFLTTASYSRAELSENEEVLYIHYGDIHTKWNHFLDISKSSLPSIQDSQIKSHSLIKEGDVIMADASEDYEGICKTIEVKNIGEQKAISGLHTFLLRDRKGTFVNGFKGYISSNKLVKNQYDRLATGLKVFGVSKGNLLSVQIPYPPNKEEQAAIAQVLSDMDAEIEELEQKRDKYIQLKTGMMQQLLTGKIRLKC